MSLLLLFAGGPPPDAGTILAGGIGSEESVGLPAITATVTILAGGIASDAVVGQPTITATYLLAVGGIASGESVGRPWVAPLLTILAGSVLSGPVVGRPRITLPSAPDPETRIVVRRADRTAPTVGLGDLAGAFARSWQDAHNNEGSGSLEFGNDDDDLAALDYFDVVRFELDGETRFAMLVERKTHQAIAGGEEADETTKVTGRGLVALLEDAVVYPVEGVDRTRFSETRTFNYASPDFNDAGWVEPVHTSIADYNRSPQGWPDTDAPWIWDRWAGELGIPEGDVYFRRSFTFAADVAVELWIDADDEYDLWLDGIKLGEDRFDDATGGIPEKFRVALQAGEHTIAAKVHNSNDEKGGFLFAALELDTNGAVASVLFNSGTAGWKMLAYPPAEPGFTPGEVLRILVDEAVARGTLGDVTLGFDDGADSNGDPWPTTGALSFPVGLDLLSVLKQVAETYFDFAMTPGLLLDAWRSRGITTGVTFSRGSNLTELTHEGSV